MAKTKNTRQNFPLKPANAAVTFKIKPETGRARKALTC